MESKLRVKLIFINMKKNVFQGFEDKEIQNLATVNGGIEYEPTGEKNTDEEAITGRKEANPWDTSDKGGYRRVDATWDNCSPN
jgi:hypothetical protein